MAFFDRSYSTASPVLGLQPQAAHQSPFGRSFLSHQSQSFSHSASCSNRPTLQSTATFAGRKRSRDEAAANLDEPDKVVPAPKVEEEDEWEYGPGMILIKKKTGYVIDATSQSGTWVEEKAAREHVQKLEEATMAQEKLSQERPSLRSHKSQRLTLTNDTPAPVQLAQPQGSPGRDKSPEAPSQPVVDEFTMHLGIGWAQLSGDEHIQAAARGWQRYIENHFPLSNAKIRLQSRGLNAYLVEAREGFFLFADDLREGRLVSRNAYCALQNLKSSPPVFDGESMTAAESPRTRPMDANPLAPAVAVSDMDVDMS